MNTSVQQQMQLVPEEFRDLWNAGEIRVAILTSLLLQIFLISLSLLRKRHSNKLLSFFLWTSYLGADYVAAILALGNLLSEQTEASEANSGPSGPPSSSSTITSYSLEDNELWSRHLLGFVLEVAIGDDTKEKKEDLELEGAWKKKWTIISGVWVEMLCFAAGTCNQYFHAKQLSQGGELLTHAWLLMIRQSTRS
ncbi:hypothetical protein GW17_00003155 [Ensete ventricosum]|nr:hypothetical protein GW17_00003155 [Ensete ventricosum]